jgi:carboxyl-terminal processing protease
MKRIPRTSILLLILLGFSILTACDPSGLPPLPTPAVSTATSDAEPTTTVVARLPEEPTARPASPTPRPPVQRTPTTLPTEVAVLPQPTPTGEALPTVQPTVVAGGGGRDGDPTTEATPTVLPLDERTRIFEEIWNTVHTNYLYSDFLGVDWQAIHDKYEPRVRAATSGDEFHLALADMVDELKDDHSRYLSPQEAREEDALQSGNANYAGVGILSNPDVDSLMVVFVYKDSPAARAGIKRRDRITAVDGIPLKDPRHEPSRIRGPKGTSVTLTVRSPGEQPREVTLVRDTITGTITPTGSRLASHPGIGYLVIPDLWTEDMGHRVQAELQTMLDDDRPLDGLILDLRGNGGGFRTVLQDILGNFVTGTVGSFFDQRSSHQFYVLPGPLLDKLRSVPVVVLVDGGSESYAEVLPGALHAKGRATTIGQPTGGNTETIYRYDLEDGSRVWVAQEGFKLPDGTNMEGSGVPLDFRIDLDWSAYPQESDPHILKAIEVLGK